MEFEKPRQCNRAACVLETGKSTGTVYVIRKCRERHVPYRVFMQKKENTGDGES